VAAERDLKLLPTVITAGPGAIAREILIDAPPDIVFTYFTDPAKHVLWQGSEVELDPRPGGTLRITFGPGYVVVGTYLEVEPPRRLVYTWGWAEEGSTVLAPGASTVEVTLERAGAATVVRLRHSRLPEDTFEFHGDGWDTSLSELKRRLRG
jgi:uncharacterized protein YndB with AHSA1/START domain